MSISKTEIDALPTLSKFLPNGVPLNACVPPNSCIPNMAKMKMNTRATKNKSLAAVTSSTIFSEKARARRDDLNNFAARKTRTNRNIRSAETPPPKSNSSSTSPIFTITKSNLLNWSEKYCLIPRAVNLRTNSAANIRTNITLRNSKNVAKLLSIPWCSTAIARVFSTTNTVVAVSK